MTNLKRVLSLALAAVMLMGMMVIGAGAANIEYTDAADIENDVAVAVLTGMDVLGGYPDGSFKPEGTLTRAEAAAVICRIMLGANVAESLSTSTAPFADVKAANWAAGYIAYLKNLGVISGIGNNKFNPQGTVTVGEFAKMLLGAAGVDGKFTGTNWLINVTVAAQQAKILSNKDVVTADATRDAVAGYTLNALNYTPDGETSEYVVKNAGGTVLYRGNDAITALLMKQADATNTLTVETTNAGSLGATVFGLKKGTKTDEFGRKSVTYTNGKDGKDEVVYATIAPEAKLTYTTETTYGKIVSALGYTKTTDKVTLNVYNNSESSSKVENVNRTTGTEVGGQGTLVQVYANGTDNYDVVVVDTYATKLESKNVIAATSASSSADAVAAHVWIDLNSNSTKDAGETFDTADFKAGDVVLYTKADGALVNVVKANFVTGTVTAVGANNAYIRLDGVQYNKSENNSGTFGSGNYAINASGTYYLDSYGNIIAYAAGTGSTDVVENLVYVIAEAAKASDTTGGDDLFGTGATTTAAQAQLKIIDLTTGEIKIVNRAVVKGTDNKYYYANSTGAATSTPVTTIDAEDQADNAGVYLYSVLDNGAYVLGAKQTGKNLTTTKGSATVTFDSANYFANSSTVLSVVEYKADMTSATVTKYTGYANFPAMTETGTAFITADATSKAVSSIVVVKEKVAQAAASYAIYKGEGETVLVDGVSKTKLAFYVDGAVVEYYAGTVTSANLTVGNVYGLTIENGAVNAKTDATALKTNKAVTYVTDEYIVVDGTAYYFAEGCDVYDKDADYATDTVAVGDTVTVYGETTNASLIIIDNP